MNNRNEMTPERIIALITEAYVRILGLEKWDSLTAKQQHDVIMIIVRDLLRTL